MEQKPGSPPNWRSESGAKVSAPCSHSLTPVIPKKQLNSPQWIKHPLRLSPCSKKLVYPEWRQSEKMFALKTELGVRCGETQEAVLWRCNRSTRKFNCFMHVCYHSPVATGDSRGCSSGICIVPHDCSLFIRAANPVCFWPWLGFRHMWLVLWDSVLPRILGSIHIPDNAYCDEAIQKDQIAKQKALHGIVSRGHPSLLDVCCMHHVRAWHACCVDSYSTVEGPNRISKKSIEQRTALLSTLNRRGHGGDVVVVAVSLSFWESPLWVSDPLELLHLYAPVSRHPRDTWMWMKNCVVLWWNWGGPVLCVHSAGGPRLTKRTCKDKHCIRLSVRTPCRTRTLVHWDQGIAIWIVLRPKLSRMTTDQAICNQGSPCCSRRPRRWKTIWLGVDCRNRVTLKFFFWILVHTESRLPKGCLTSKKQKRN